MTAMRWSVLALLALVAAPASAQQPPAPCPAVAPLPPELAGWASPAPVAAGMSAADAPALAIGRAARATLMPASHLRFAPAPEKPGAPEAPGGLFAFTVAEAGRYRVALGAGAWIDVVRDGRALASVGHGHGPDCSGVRKMVDFDLTPGRYVVQIAGSPDPALTLMVARVSK